jgi:hypothetical protein
MGAAGDRAANLVEAAAGGGSAAKAVVLDPVARESLEAALRAIEAEVVRRTDDDRLRQAGRNLLDDCRAAFEAGDRDSALASARHLARSIPAYLTARGIP